MMRSLVIHVVLALLVLQVLKPRKLPYAGFHAQRRASGQAALSLTAPERRAMQRGQLKKGSPAPATL
jgi:hypothetical protein